MVVGCLLFLLELRLWVLLGVFGLAGDGVGRGLELLEDVLGVVAEVVDIGLLLGLLTFFEGGCLLLETLFFLLFEFELLLLAPLVVFQHELAVLFVVLLHFIQNVLLGVGIAGVALG